MGGRPWPILGRPPLGLRAQLHFPRAGTSDTHDLCAMRRPTERCRLRMVALGAPCARKSRARGDSGAPKQRQTKKKVGSDWSSASRREAKARQAGRHRLTSCLQLAHEVNTATGVVVTTRMPRSETRWRRSRRRRVLQTCARFVSRASAWTEFPLCNNNRGAARAQVYVKCAGVHSYFHEGTSNTHRGACHLPAVCPCSHSQTKSRTMRCVP